MIKCIICGNEKEGIICRHCIAVGASKTGNVIKGVTKVAIQVVPLVISLVVLRKKSKT